MWGTDAERWQKESRPLTHSNLGPWEELLPPPMGAIGGFSGREREVSPPRKTSGRGSRGQETSPRGYGDSPGGREPVGQEGWEVRNMEDPSHYSRTQAWCPKEKPFPRGSDDPRFTSAEQHPLRPESVT